METLIPSQHDQFTHCQDERPHRATDVLQRSRMVEGIARACSSQLGNTLQYVTLNIFRDEQAQDMVPGGWDTLLPTRQSFSFGANASILREAYLTDSASYQDHYVRNTSLPEGVGANCKGMQELRKQKGEVCRAIVIANSPQRKDPSKNNYGVRRNEMQRSYAKKSVLFNGHMGSECEIGPFPSGSMASQRSRERANVKSKLKVKSNGFVDGITAFQAKPKVQEEGLSNDSRDLQNENGYTGHLRTVHLQKEEAFMTYGRSHSIGRTQAISVPLHSHWEWNSLDSSIPERWAGPAFSNSPPPSSLPMPKFSMRELRASSLDASTSKPAIPDGGLVSSQGKSLRRFYSLPSKAFSVSGFSSGVANATDDLRRILNLDQST